MPTIRHCPPDQAERIRRATGKDFPPGVAEFALDRLPATLADDLEKVHRAWGSITAATFLACSTTASLGDIKSFLDRRGWHSSVD